MLITRETEGLLKWTEESIKGKVVIIDPEYFNEEFKDAKYQMVIALGGFGCVPGNIGNAVFILECTKDNPEEYRNDRRYILGIASEDDVIVLN